jgi:hypothetical protein
MIFKSWFFIILGMLASTVGAQNVPRLINQLRIDPQQRSAIVLFKADSDSDYWLEKVKRLMRTQDDMAVLNPYWIVQFTDESIDSSSRCGVVVGRWYTSGYLHKERWEQILENGLSKLRYTVLYVNTEGKLAAPDPSQANKLLQQCG